MAPEQPDDDPSTKTTSLPTGQTQYAHVATDNTGYVIVDYDDREAAEIIARVDRALDVEEALTARLLRRYGI